MQTFLVRSQLKFFCVTPQRDLSMFKTSSTETLAVEEVLGSFDFLSTDFNADEISCMGSVRIRDTGWVTV